jgi:hypothetical protein
VLSLAVGLGGAVVSLGVSVGLGASYDDTVITTRVPCGCSV